jgi:protein TonB
MISSSPYSRRATGAAAAVLIQAALGWLLINGLQARVTREVAAALTVFDVEPVPPPAPPPVPVRHAARRASGAAAPPHARAQPTIVVAPPPVIRLPPPPPLVVAAPVAALGRDAAAGAADRGDGTGAGGQGNGLGAGRGGDGTGAGGTPARQIAGDISWRDYPRAAREAGIEGDVTTRYIISTKGRIDRCTIVRSSGNDLLDSTACRLPIQRFRYDPARDGSGRPVEDVIEDTHHFHIDPDPSE